MSPEPRVGATGLRAFVPPERIVARRLELRGADAARMSTRGASPGDVVEVLDNAGWAFDVRLDAVGPERCDGTVLARRRAREPRTKIGLFHGLLGPADMRRMVARATAAGVVGLHPVISEGCLVPAGGPGAEREADEDAGGGWDALAREAAEASGRGQYPAIAPPMLLDQALDLAARGGSLCVVVDRDGGDAAEILADRPFSIALFCPPADRFAARERELAAARGARAVRVTAGRDADPVAAALAALGAIFAALERTPSA